MGYVPYVGFATYRRATMMNRLMFYKCFVQKKKRVVTVKPSGHGPILGRIALLWKGGRRRPSGGS
jgi:hypothetical protein